jgi:hypothetical protein
MAGQPEIKNMALFCDFENLALGVRDAKYAQFDMKKVLERLLLKGSIIVKKAYCDWERYKAFKASMHEAAFELIEIPHVRQSGKNSADIRLVVDALDLCYTKAHVDTFVILQRRFGFLAAGVQTARKQQGRHRGRRQEIYVRSAHRELRRLPVLRRRGARAGTEEKACGEARDRYHYRRRPAQDGEEKGARQAPGGS